LKGQGLCRRESATSEVICSFSKALKISVAEKIMGTNYAIESLEKLAKRKNKF